MQLQLFPLPETEYVDAAKMAAGEKVFDVDKDFHTSDNLMAAELYIPAGLEVGKHIHTYSHLSVLAKGKVVVEKFRIGEDAPFEVLELSAHNEAQVVEIKANIYHRITAIEDAQWFCIHANLGG